MDGDQSNETGGGYLTINEIIIKALEQVGYPVRPAPYYKKADTYFAFAINTIPGDYGDNAPGHEIHHVQAHFCCPLHHDSVEDRREAKRAMHEAGFVISGETDMSDEDGQDHVIECEYAMGVDWREKRRRE